LTSTSAISVSAQQLIDPIDRGFGAFAQCAVPFGKPEQGLALVMRQRLWRRFETSLHTRQRAFQSAKGKYQASIGHLSSK